MAAMGPAPRVLASAATTSSAADATAMPPPPPPAASSMAGAAVPSALGLPPARATVAVVAPAVPSSSGVVARTGLGTPSPLASVPVAPPPQRPAAVPQPILSPAPSSSAARRVTVAPAAHPHPQQRAFHGYPARAPVASAAPSSAAAAALSRPTIAGASRVSPMPSATATQPAPPAPAENPSSGAPSSSSGASSGSSPTKKKPAHPLRRGKWTTEEEAYANRLIGEFKSGLLPLTDGTTLRNFLSKLLNCDPMRISKKFVGNNCIGKQVFRRRVVEINRLTPERMQQMKAELSELERRFFDRVAQTNRVKSPGVSLTGGAIAGILAPNGVGLINVGGGKLLREEMEVERPPTPPWLRPPANYEPKGKYAERTRSRAAATTPTGIGAPLPSPTHASGPQMQRMDPQRPQGASASLAPPPGLSAPPMAPAQSAPPAPLVQAAVASSGEEFPRTESALEQLARTASAAKFVEDIVNGENSSLGDSQEQGDKKLSRATLQGSFEALMSMDIHSVENLVELASTSQSTTLLSDLNKSKSSDGGAKSSQSSVNRLESFIKTLSSANLLKPGVDSSAALGSLLRSGQDSSAALGSLLNAAGSDLLRPGLDSSAALGSLLNAASSNLLRTGSGSQSAIFDAEKFSRRVESATGFSQLRAEDGLAAGHDSVDDFLSLVASGDIPHQDPNMLKVPLQKVMQQPTAVPRSGSKRKLSQQQLVALASRLSTSKVKLEELTYPESLKRPKRK